MRHILAHLAIAARRRSGKHAFFIGKNDFQSVYFEFKVIGGCRAAHFAYPLVKGAHLDLRKRISKGPLRHLVSHLLQERQRGAHDSPGNRICARKLRVLLFKRAELAIESVVGAVGELRRIKRVVLASVMREKFLKLRDSFLNLS